MVASFSVISFDIRLVNYAQYSESRVFHGLFNAPIENLKQKGLACNLSVSR